MPSVSSFLPKSVFGRAQTVEPANEEENNVEIKKPVNRPLEQLKANVYGE